MKTRTESIIVEKYKLIVEAEKILEEKAKIQKMVLQMNSDFYQLKSDKFKSRAHKKLIQNTQIRIADRLNRLNRQKGLASPKRNFSANEKENLDYSVLELSESVLPVNNSDSPVPDESVLENL